MIKGNNLTIKKSKHKGIKMNELLATVFGFSVIFLATTLGASLVFAFRKDFSAKSNSIFVGVAAGIMLAASVWSLILPSIDGAESYGAFRFLPALIGILVGGAFLHLTEKATAKLIAESGEKGDGKYVKATKMFIAITVHNIPEGLAVGFAFGAAVVVGTSDAYVAALGLAVGIAIQNFPEGAAVSLPLKDVTKNKFSAFLYGVASGAIEPIMALCGYFTASVLSAYQPWFLSFAAGAMIFVVADDLIPESKLDSSPHIGTWAFVAGFAIMMVLDVAFG